MSQNFSIKTLVTACLSLACLQACQTSTADQLVPQKTATIQNLAHNVSLPRFPAINPKGTQALFSYHGDIWITPVQQNSKPTRLTVNAQNDIRPQWATDGKSFFFNSNRTGAYNVFNYNLTTGSITQITHGSSGYYLDSASNNKLTLSTYKENDTYPGPRPYQVSTQGGQPTRLLNAFGTEAVISPDGENIAFTRGMSRWRRRHYRGPDNRQLWLYNTQSQKYTQLTTWNGNDGLPRWSSNTTLCYISDRKDRTYNIYKRDINKSEDSAQQLTFHKEKDIWTFDLAQGSGTVLYKSWDRLYYLKDNKSVAMNLTASQDRRASIVTKDVSKSITDAVLSPDGNVMAYIAYGDIYIRNTADESVTKRITTNIAKEQDLAWSPDGQTLYFVSDRTGKKAVYTASVKLTKEDLFPKPKEDENTEDKKIKNSSAKNNENKPAQNDPKTDQNQSKSDQNGAKSEKTAQNEPVSHKWESVLTFTIKPFIKHPDGVRSPSPSPDGKSLAYIQGIGTLLSKNLKTNKNTLIIKSADSGIHWSWSPNSQYIAYATDDANFNTDIWVIPATAVVPAVNITQHPDIDYGPVWSADSKKLAFSSNRVSNEFDIWLVNLDKSLDDQTKLQKLKYYKEAGAAIGKRKPLPINPPKSENKKDAQAPENKELSEDNKEGVAIEVNEEISEVKQEPKLLELDLADAYLRLSRKSTLQGGEHNVVISPDGATIYFVNGKSFYSIAWDKTTPKKLGSKITLGSFDLKGKSITYIASGQAGALDKSGKKKALAISSKVQLDLAAQNSQKFLEAARLMHTRFYHPDMKGLNWEKLTKEYHELAKNAVTDSTFSDIGNRLLGELNASHLGISKRSPVPNAQPASGYLGITYDIQDNGSYLISNILMQGPSDKKDNGLKPGDLLTQVNLKDLSSQDPLDHSLIGTVGKETILTVKRKLGNKLQTAHVAVIPMDTRKHDALTYVNWRNTIAQKVEKLSNGRLGYIHIKGMNQASLDVYERDLYAAANGKDGLLIDVRSNGGGFTTDLLLASIMVKPHAYTIPRGGQRGYPRDRLYIQRYTQPINMLCNERSFSNAEIISHAFKTLGRGTLIGNQTYGGVISTGSQRLIDGTTVRMPFRGWYLPDGTDMENNGAIPDIIVLSHPADEAAGNDKQLKVAVENLLKRLPVGKK